MRFSGRIWRYLPITELELFDYMNKTVKYISYFDFQDAKVERGYVTAATNKIESICDILNSIGYSVDIISMSAVTESKFHLYRGSKTERHKGLSLKLFSSWGGTNKILKAARLFWHLLAMFLYLVFHTKKDEVVIVYHSQGYFDVVRWAKKLRRFKMILEVEEIYDDVSKPRFKAMSGSEKRMIADADGFIFPTELLNDKINSRHRPYVIIYGTYRTEPKISERFDDGKIHVLYAGTFDPQKGGAVSAAAAAEFLPKQYHLHICGFGTEHDTLALKREISAIQKKSEATITFDGLKKGREYVEFIQKCHIGLSTQNPHEDFNDTSFPSKILSYMANGIAVVSIDIPAVSTASIAPYIKFYKEQTPENIARAILETKLENDNRAVVAELAKQFKCEIARLIEETKVL